MGQLDTLQASYLLLSILSDQILEDGGDATHLMLKKYSGTAKYLKGVVEESVTGIHRCVSGRGNM